MTTTAPQQTEASAVADIVKQHIEPRVVDLESPVGEDVKVLILPTGLRAHSIKPFIDEFRTEPERRRGIAVFHDLESFIEHTERFKDEGSALFAGSDPEGPSLTSVLDYHPARPVNPKPGE